MTEINDRWHLNALKDQLKSYHLASRGIATD